MESDSTVLPLLWSITIGQLLQCVDAHYYGEEETYNLFRFRPHMGNTLTQMVQNLNVKYGIHCFTNRYIFLVNYTFAAKK